MWKYIVTYIIVTFSGGPCPEPLIKYDEFGRELPRERHLRSELCLIKDTSYKEKIFDTRKDATDFIERGQKKDSSVWDKVPDNGQRWYATANKGIGELSNFKLDSIPIKQYDCTHMETWTTMLLCVPPDPNCNKTTCQKCGKQWQTY